MQCHVVKRRFGLKAESQFLASSLLFRNAVVVLAVLMMTVVATIVMWTLMVMTMPQVVDVSVGDAFRTTFDCLNLNPKSPNSKDWK